MHSRRTFWIMVPLVIVALAADAAGQRVWDFTKDAVGAIPNGVSVFAGRWEVAVQGDNHVLVQKAASDQRVFNLALIDGTKYQDLDVSVRLKADGGVVDQGGGVVWRARDKDNYYVARYNPLEDNLRVYKVENRRRTQLDHAEIPGDREWHTLRITMKDREIFGYLDGKKLLVAEDSTFPDAGMVGLWSKADAQTFFDDLSVSESPR